MRRFLLRDLALPLAFYTLVALIITYPLVTQLTTHVAGAVYGDSFEYVRLGWWGRYALQHGLNPFYQSQLVYPDGFLSAAQIAQPLIYWPISLLGFIFGDVAAFNLWILLEVILSGLTAYLLCRDVCTHISRDMPTATITLAALPGGLIFTAFPTVQGHLSAGHVNPLSNYAVPLVALCLFRIATRRGSPRIALAGGLALWVLALGNFTFPVYVVLPLILFGGLYVLFTRRFRLIMLRDATIMFLVGAVLTLPFYVPLIAEALAPNRPIYLQEAGSVRYSTDLLGFFAPSPFTPWGARLAPEFSRAVLGTNSIESTAYLGIAALVLAAVGLVRRREGRLWLIIALGCMVFSLGTLLKVNDQLVVFTIDNHQSNITLPWALFQNLPLFNVTRTPGRFNIITGLALGVMAALGAQVVFQQIARSRVFQGLATGMLAGFILFEYQLFAPFPTTGTALPQIFRDLAARTDIRAVLDVPYNDFTGQRFALLQQTVHRKPLIAGYVSRRTPLDPAKLNMLTDIATGRAAQIGAQFVKGAVVNRDAMRGILKANGVDVLIYHWELLDHDVVAGYATATFGPPLYMDDQIGVFSVPSPETPGAPPSLYLPSREGWWVDETTDAPQWWATSASEIYVYTAAPTRAAWSLNLTPLLHPRNIRLAVDGMTEQAWTTSGSESRDFVVSLDAGFQTLRLEVTGGCTNVPIYPRCLLPGSESSAPGCALPPTGEERAKQLSPSVCVSARIDSISIAPDASSSPFQARDMELAEGMRFRGYAMWPRDNTFAPGERLRIETHWRAEQKLPGDYHLFVHLLDKQGTLITQFDTVPGGNTYPTTEWTAPQNWQEMATLELPSDLAPGIYELYAGWYRYPDITRLSVWGDGRRASDGYVFLQEIEAR